MALVSSPIQFSRGSFGNMCFYKDHLGRCIARQKRIVPFGYLEDPKRIRQKNSTTEFAAASVIASRLRKPFQKFIQCCSDASYYNRMMGLLRHAAWEDASSPIGKRSSTRGQISLLEGFEFNKDRHLNQALNADYVTWYDPATHKVRVDIDSFIPKNHVRAPKGAKYCQLVLVVNVAGPDEFKAVREVTNLIRVNSNEPQSHSLSLQAVDIPGEVLTVSLGSIFYEEYMGVQSMIRGGSMAFIEVHKLIQPEPLTNTQGDAGPNDDGMPITPPDPLKDWRDARLAARYPAEVLSGETNKYPAGNMTYKTERLRRHLFHQEMEKLRRG